MTLDASQTLADAEPTGHSGQLTTSPRLDRQRDLDDWDLVEFDGPRLELGNPARRRPWWLSSVVRHTDSAFDGAAFGL